MFDGGNGGDAGEVDKHKEQEAVGGELREVVGVVAIEHADGAGHNLLGTDTCNEADIESPVEALNGKDGFYGLSSQSDEAIFQ